MVMIVQSVYIYTTNTFIFIHFYHRIRQKIFVTLEHKTSLKSLEYVFSISQKYMGQNDTFFFMPKIVRILSKYHVP